MRIFRMLPVEEAYLFEISPGTTVKRNELTVVTVAKGLIRGVIIVLMF